MKLARKAVLSGNALKLIAIAAMTVDHLTWVIFPGYQTNVGILLLHSIGRLTAPIMCFFIAEGYYYTHDRKRYAARLFLFALISHFAYNFAFGIPFAPFRTGIFNQTGVMWALAWGLAALCVLNSVELKQWHKTGLMILICAISFCADWSCIAVLVIVAFGTNRGDFKKQMAGIQQDAGFIVLHSGEKAGGHGGGGHRKTRPPKVFKQQFKRIFTSFEQQV